MHSQINGNNELEVFDSVLCWIRILTYSLCFRSPIKSIFEGATKYDILHYLEDARDRGLTDVELDLEEEDDEEVEEKVEYSMDTATLSQ